MSPTAIPDWNPQGVLPPINSTNPTSVDRSPYAVPITDLILHYGTTLRRQTILSGFLAFRAALHSAGLTQGFQWIDGSFLENIEEIERRDPGDVDVVTFFHLPNGQTQQDLLNVQPLLFNPADTKTNYHVDAYFVQLDGNTPEPLVEQSTYWYSLWSHRRNGLWKGFLQIDLSPTDNAVAKANLDKMSNQGGQP